MTEAQFDVLGIGNAIVDVIAPADDASLERLGLAKGAMTLIDARRAAELYAAMPAAIESSGGSAANTIACLASLGGRGAFIGKVRDDQWGEVFRHDIRALGIAFETRPATAGAPTARCLVFVTPDAQRTMQTYLGACVELAADDVSEREVAAARVTYLEGYLWDPPAAKQAFIKAAGIAHAAGRSVALSLSDPFCVERHRADFLDLVRNHVDVLFANEHEIMALYQTDRFEQAADAVRKDCAIAALTRSERGSVIVTADAVQTVAAEPVAEVVDTTGAGDAYAAGFLFGLTRGFDHAVSARLGSIAAAHVIGHLGARPERALDQVASERLGTRLAELTPRS